MIGRSDADLALGLSGSHCRVLGKGQSYVSWKVWKMWEVATGCHETEVLPWKAVVDWSQAFETLEYLLV